MTGFDIFTTALVVVSGFQLYVSLRLIFWVGYTVRQKIAQLLIIWCVPLIGAILVQSLLVADSTLPRKTDAAFTSDGGNNPPGLQ